MNIDSDKLLELIDEHEDRLCRVDTRIIRDAIQSGELTPKRVYARAPEGVREYLTPGKEYEVLTPSAFGEFVDFDIINDDGYRISCGWDNSSHIKTPTSDAWKKVEK